MNKIFETLPSRAVLRFLICTVMFTPLHGCNKKKKDASDTESNEPSGSVISSEQPNGGSSIPGNFRPVTPIESVADDLPVETATDAATSTNSAQDTDTSVDISPTGFTAAAEGFTKIDLTWASSGASGYLLIARAGSAVSFTPIDGTVYSSGAQGSDTILFVGSTTSFSHESLTPGTVYHYRLYAYDSSQNYSSAINVSETTDSLNCGSLAGGTWVEIPGDPIYGTSYFCVQKYVPTNVSSIPTSKANSSSDTPWVSITQPAAKSSCAALGAGYHLITNSEWMTIAANLANVASNWSGGSVGSGELTRGHSDNNPNQACAADADDSKGWVESTCTGQTQGALAFRERRTRTLSNGNVIWDFGGNVWQWVDAYDANGKPGTASNAWNEYSAMGNGTTNWPRSAFVPVNSAHSWWNDNWNSNQSIGQIYPGTNGSGGSLGRGAAWTFGSGAGSFAAYLNNAPSYSGTQISFRCAYNPVTSRVNYNANGATSGTVPTDNTAYAVTQPVSISVNSGSLARTGYAFAGWNTAADGSGTTYSTGSTTLTMGTSDVNLYATWVVPTCGDSAQNNCYTGPNAANYKAAGSVTTATGKSLSYNYTKAVWEENGGTRVLEVNGTDAWQMQLNPNGRSFSSSFLNKANVAGRACPANVYVNDINMVATGRCLYYDAGNPNQRLDATANDGVTNQSTAGAYRLGGWNTSAGGNSTGASWYEGNIQTCAAKGMRLPTLYETAASDPGGSYKPTDATPTGWGNGVPHFGTTWTRTASAWLNHVMNYWHWLGTSTTDYAYSNSFSIGAVRCVVQ